MDSYSECVKSRFEDIRRDGGSIYVNLLELIENSFEWGKSDSVTIKYREGKLSLRDYGVNGFISKESVERFFKLGVRNNLVKETTIGKYGKGGYKALITLGTSITIITNIDGKYYKIGTDFNNMIEDNKSSPTIPLREISEEYLEEEGFNIDKGVNGTLMSINLRDVYNNKINMEDFNRVITRAYHDCYKGKEITLDFRNNNKVIEIGSENLIKNHRSKVIRKLIYNKNKSKYELKPHNYSINENEIEIGNIEEYVLSDMLTKLPYLGDKPGCDVYRNNRLLNIADPCRNIGINGELMDKGQMRGLRCHVILRFQDKNISDNISVDDHIATSTQKELTCTDKMDESLVKCVEDASKNCNKKYEDIVKEEKELLKTFIDGLENKLIANNLTLNDCISLKSEINNFKTNKSYYKIDGGFKFCNKTEADNNMGEVKVRINNPAYIKLTSDSFVSKLNKLIDIKQKEELIKKLNENYGNIIPIISKYQNRIHSILILKKLKKEKEEKEENEKKKSSKKVVKKNNVKKKNSTGSLSENKDKTPGNMNVNVNNTRGKTDKKQVEINMQQNFIDYEKCISEKLEKEFAEQKKKLEEKQKKTLAEQKKHLKEMEKITDINEFNQKRKL